VSLQAITLIDPASKYPEGRGLKASKFTKD
jgi:hypothetical protein